MSTQLLSVDSSNSLPQKDENLNGFKLLPASSIRALSNEFNPETIFKLLSNVSNDFKSGMTVGFLIASIKGGK